MYRGLSLKFLLELDAAKHSSGPMAPTNPIKPADAVRNAAADDDKNSARVENDECDDFFAM